MSFTGEGTLPRQPEQRQPIKAQQKAKRGVNDAICQWRKAKRTLNKIPALRMPAMVFFCFVDRAGLRSNDCRGMNAGYTTETLDEDVRANPELRDGIRRFLDDAHRCGEVGRRQL
jgi:hypothetical protein